MPKIDQQSIRIFHILDDKNDGDLLEFLKKNLPLFKGYLLVFDNLSESIKEFLDSNDVDYIKNKHLRFMDNKDRVTHIVNELNKQQIISHQDNYNTYSSRQNMNLHFLKSKFITKLVRSGESIISDGDILVFNRVNSGAEIESQNNICIFGECSGDVKCEGEFLILSKIVKGKVVFQGEIITPNMLKYKLNLIYKDDNNLNIKDILSL